MIDFATLVLNEEDGACKPLEIGSERLAKLRADLVAAGVPEAKSCADNNSLLTGLDPASGYVFVTGFSPADKLIETCKRLRDAGYGVIVVFDALTHPSVSRSDRAARTRAFHAIESDSMQIASGAQCVHLAARLKKGKKPLLEIYAKCAVACTTAILMPRDDGSFDGVFIVRADDPFEGCWALSGGFLEPWDIDGAGRELNEEISVRPLDGELTLVLVQLDPERDPRGPVKDIVKLWLLEGERKERLLGKFAAADDARELKVMKVEDVMDKLAFDHKESLQAAIAKAREIIAKRQ